MKRQNYLIGFLLSGGCAALLAYRALARQSPLIEAIKAHDSASVANFLKSGTCGDPNEYFSDVIRPGMLVAAEQGDTRIVECFLGRGENVNLSDNYGFTALSLAACEGHADVARLLIKHGADVNEDHPIAEARRAHHADIAQMLKRAGAIE